MRKSGYDVRPPPAEAVLLSCVTLGCPKNLVDAERMLGQLALTGFVLTDEPRLAEVVLVNTCDFIGPASAESREAIRKAAGLKRRGRCRRLVVAGCMAQRRREALLAEFPQIDAIVGVFDRERVVEACRGGGPQTLVSDPHRMGADVERLRLTPRHTGYLRIAEGCDNRCAYCVIPSIRGPLTSKPIPEVLREAKELAADGAVELNLIAQDTTAYGRDRPERPALTDLLGALAALDGLRWVRLLYAHPAHVTDDLLEFIARTPAMCRYLDLPLQHASDAVLRAMGRRVTAAQVRHLLARARSAIPGVAIRTTFIVGFPGETEEDFEQVLDLMREARFDRLGAFAYSREPGTAAADRSDQVPEAVKARRLHALLTLQQEIAFNANRRLVGHEVEVLVDGPSSRCRSRAFARTQGHAPEIDGGVHVKAGEQVKPGTFHRVRVTGWKDYDLLAEAVV